MSKPISLDEVLERFAQRNGGNFTSIDRSELKFSYESISYSLPSVGEGGDKVIPKQTLINNSSLEQTQSFEWQETKANSFSWTLQTALNVGTTVEASVGIPLIAEGKISSTMELNLSTTEQQTSSKDQQWGVDIPVRVPPYRRMVCESVITSGVVDVPFEATVFIEGSVTFHHQNGWVKENINVILFIIELYEGEVFGYRSILTDQQRGILAFASGVVKGAFGVDIITQFTESPLESGSDAPLSVVIIPERLRGLQQEVLDRISRNPSQKLKKHFVS